MPTVTLNKTVFEELVGRTLPLDKLKDRISMLGTDLEGINEEEIEVEIFPNRPDMLSEQGFARAFSSFIGEKTGLRKFNVKPSGEKVIVDKSVTMRPYTACAIVKNLTFTDERIREVMQMQEKLARTHGRDRKKSAYGVYPIDNINFPVTYIAKNPSKVMFHPLGFNHKIPADKVESEHPTGPKYKHVAEGWTEFPFFIDAKGNVMSMLPYTNSHDTGKVELDTKNVFIECSGTDLKNVLVALHIFVAMFDDMGGDIYSIEMEYHDKTFTTPNLAPSTMKLDLPYINKLLGLTLTEKDAKKCLEQMGYGYEKGTVQIPAYRADVIHQVDLMEDIAIAYGYENFEHIIPNVSTIGEEAPLENLLRKIREMLIGHGLLEAKNYHLVTEDELNQKMNLEEDVVSLLNAVGEQNHLRNAIIPSLMKTLTENQHHEYPQNIFEIGRTFQKKEDTETGVDEGEKLAVVLCHEKTDFTEIRQILDSLMNSLGIECTIKEAEHASYIEGRVGEMWVGDEKLGVIGELHPQVLDNWDVIVPVVCFELDVEKVFMLVG